MSAATPSTPDELRNFVRTLFETDDQELPDDLLDVFLSEGYENIWHMPHDWPHLQVSFELTTVADQGAYPIGDLMATDDVLQTITSLVLTSTFGGRLYPMEHGDAEARFLGPTTPTSTPMFYSVYGTDLYLWPVPSAAFTISGRGVRQPVDWADIADNETIDLPAPLRKALIWWAMRCVYDQQEDPEMSQRYEGKFHDTVRRAARTVTTLLTVSPIVMNQMANRGYDRSKAWIEQLGRTL